MKIQVGVDKGSYSFDASARKVTLLHLNTVQIEQVLLITNVTDNTIIYDFTDSSLGATLTGNVITLTCDTSAMSDTDRLQIFISYESDEAMLLRRLCKLLEPISVQDSSQRQRVAVEALPTLAAVTTVSTLTTCSTVTTVGTLSAITTQPVLQQYEMMDRARISYAEGIRNRLYFS